MHMTAHPSTHPLPRRGFTLTELLVTVVIIAALAAIVTPFIRSGIRSANRASCLNNLRQIGTGLATYAQENGNRMPQIAVGRESKAEEIPVLETALEPYLDSEEVFHCPEDKELFKKSGSSYFWNPTQIGLRLTKLEFFGTSNPQRIPLVFDKEAWHGEGDEGTMFLYADWTASDGVEFNIDP